MTELASRSPLPLVPDTADAGALDHHRVELTAYCYRMLGSAFDAEDAVQEALVRAWRAFDRFEGRAPLRAWLYRIATNVCMDMLEGRRRRAMPMDLSPVGRVEEPLAPPLPASTWIEPVPDGRVIPETADPAELAQARESVRLAFVAALQHLPPRQRAVLILRDVLRWRADEVAGLLDTTTASVNSALQRARATLAAAEVSDASVLEPRDDGQRRLLERYVAAFEAYDMRALTALLHEEATHSMPPFPLWIAGADQVAAWMLGPGHACRGSRLVPVVANGLPAFGQYKPSAEPGVLEPWSVNVLEIHDGRITGLTWFLDTARLFPLFGLPAQLGTT